MTGNGNRPDGRDVVELLMEQHGQIRALFAELEGAVGDRRRDAFRRLVRLLAMQVTAEKEIVHPTVRGIDDGEAVVDARIAEEHRTKQLLSTLDKVGSDADGFDTLLIQLRDDILAHAAHEEREEFPAAARGVRSGAAAGNGARGQGGRVMR